MKKKLLSLLLASLMATTLLPVSAFADELEAEGEAGDIVEINMVNLGFFGENGKEEVLEAINAISEKEIGVHLNFTTLDIQSYMTQVPLMITDTSNPIDLVLSTAIPTTSFATFTAQNQLMDISGYLEEYAPETLELMSEYLPATTIGDAVYAIPCYRIYNSSYYLVMRMDILEELGLTEQAKAISSWPEAKAVLQAVHDAQDSLPPELQTTAEICNMDTHGNVMLGMYVDPAADNFADDFGFDTLGDSNRIIMVDENDNKVVNFFATEDYKKILERVKDWYDSDLVYKDSATSQDGADQNMAHGITFAYCVQSEIGVEQAKKNETGYDVLCVPYVDVPIQTGNGNSWAWGVPVTSEEPEAAVAFMNLMYTNPEIENLLVYGVEGRDYELNDAGEACLLPTKEYQSSDFFWGNQFIAYPAENTGSDFREKSLEHMNAAEISPYYGCVVNTDPIANTLTALKGVLTKYQNGLESGSADLGDLDKMLSELEGAGLQEYLDYYQSQLDEWLANNQ